MTLAANTQYNHTMSPELSVTKFLPVNKISVVSTKYINSGKRAAGGSTLDYRLLI